MPGHNCFSNSSLVTKAVGKNNLNHYCLGAIV
jgi:hypothetical protein